jgi:uncharacterized membrane protein
MFMNARNEQQKARNDSAHWSRLGIFGLYFNKQDPRTWVAKTIPALGWTPNLAKPAGAGLFLGALLLPVAVVVAIVIATGLP